MAFKMKKPLFNGTIQHKKELKDAPLKQNTAPTDSSEVDTLQGGPKASQIAKAVKYTPTALAAEGVISTSAASAILNHPVMKVVKFGAGEAAAAATPLVNHALLQRKYKKMYPDSEHSWYTEDPRFQAEWQGGEGLDFETGLPKMNVSQRHAISGGWFGAGEYVFPTAKASYLEELNKALKNKTITKEKYDNAIKTYNL